MKKKVRIWLLGLAAALILVAAGCGQQSTTSTAKKSKSSTDSASHHYEQTALFQDVFMKNQGVVAESRSYDETLESLNALDTSTFTTTGDQANHKITVTAKDATAPTVVFGFDQDNYCTSIAFNIDGKSALVKNSNGTPKYYKVTGSDRSEVKSIKKLQTFVKTW
jgi:ABC-type enterochelin transport system substrate-binding protein